MLSWPTLGVLIAVALPVAIIFLVLGIFRIVQLQAERAVRSPEYWNETPDGRRYPTGWGEEEPPSGATSAQEDGPSPGERPQEGEPGPEPPEGDTPGGDGR